jgi:hypothetical protein
MTTRIVSRRAPFGVTLGLCLLAGVAARAQEPAPALPPLALQPPASSPIELAPPASSPIELAPPASSPVELAAPVAPGAAEERPAPPPVLLPIKLLPPASGPAELAPARPVRLYRDACMVRAPEEEAKLDAAQRRLFETVCRANRWFDGLFGVEDPEAASRVTGRAELGGLYSDYDGFKVRSRFHARWQFPNLDRRVNAFVGREEEDEFVQDRTAGIAVRSSFFDLESDEDWLAGLGYSLPSSGRRRTDLQVGAKLSSSPEVFVQGRVRWVFFPSENTAWRLRETVFYQNRDGFGLTSTIDRDRVLTPRVLLRWGARATISEATEGVEWRTALVLYQNLPGDHAMAWELFSSGESSDEVPLHEYGMRVLFRQRFFVDGVHAVSVVGYSFPRHELIERREGSFTVGFSIEIAFGRWLALH